MGNIKIEPKTESNYAYMTDLTPEKLREGICFASLDALDEIAKYITPIQYTYCRIMLDKAKSQRLTEAYEAFHSIKN